MFLNSGQIKDITEYKKKPKQLLDFALLFDLFKKLSASNTDGKLRRGSTTFLKIDNGRKRLLDRYEHARKHSVYRFLSGFVRVNAAKVGLISNERKA